jgi:hypothetical protein
MVEAGMSELFGAIFEVVFEIVAYLVGRMVVELLSLGHVKCLPANMKVKQHERRAGGLYIRRRNRSYVSDDVVSLIGLLSMVLTVAGAGCVWWLLRK